MERLFLMFLDHTQRRSTVGRTPLDEWSSRRRDLYLTTHDTHNIYLVVCLTTGPKPLPKRALHLVQSRASSFKWDYPLLSLRSSNSFLRLLPCLPVTSIPPCIFPSITRRRRQFLRKTWPIQFAFRFRISCIYIYIYMYVCMYVCMYLRGIERDVTFPFVQTVTITVHIYIYIYIYLRGIEKDVIFPFVQTVTITVHIYICIFVA